ncbi:MAG: hypothetical protein ACRDA3_13070 [Peptostreptococcaceae bacterium]
MAKLTNLQKLSLDVCRGSVEKYSVKDGSDAIRRQILEAMGTDEWDIYKFQQNKFEVYRILSEAITVALAELTLGKYDDWVEYKDLALGDTVEFYIPNNDLFEVGYVADGTNELRRQRITNKKLAMSGFPLGLKIYEEFLSYMMGRVDWSDMVNRVAASFDYKLSEIIIKQLEGAYNGLDAKYVKSGSYNEEELLDLVQRVEAKTGQKCTIFGSKKALMKIRQGVGTILSNVDKEDIRNHGFITVIHGTPVVEIPQVLDKNDNYALKDDMLFVIPTGETKMVKLGFEGDAYIYEVNDPSTRMDQQIEYMIMRRCQIGVCKANYYGVYHSIV